MIAYTLWHQKLGLKLWSIEPTARLVREAVFKADPEGGWADWRKNGWKVVKIKIENARDAR